MNDTKTDTTQAPASEGLFLADDGRVYRVVRSKGSGNLYAKRLNERGGFDYEPGAIRRLTETDRMSVEMAKAWGRRFGVCANCGAMLTDPPSIAAGIGPVCAGKGYWSNSERADAKEALDWDQMLADQKAEREREAREIAAAVPAPVYSEPEVAKRAAGVLSVAGAVAVLDSTYDPEAVAAARAIPGRKWDAARKVNTFPVNDTTGPLLAALAQRFGYTVEGDTLPDGAEVEARRIANIKGSGATDASIEVEVGGPDDALLPFQKAAVAFGVRNDGTLLADDMGLGKTVEALATLAARDAFPALVIAPANVKVVWQRHVARWLPGRSVAVIVGRSKGAAAPDADITIINYDLVDSWLPRLQERGYAALIADESHYLKNSKAKRSKAVKALAKKIGVRILATGTPALNRPVEIANQLDVLGHLDAFGGFMAFAKRYCNAFHDGYGWNFSGASNLEELHTRLREVCMVRRTKAEVLTELPAKRRAIVPLEITNRAEYDDAEDDLAAFYKAQAERAGLVGEDAESEAAERVEAAERAEEITRINRCKIAAARGKVEPVIEWIRNFMESGSKLVVFAEHHEIVDALAAPFGADTVTGRNPESRQAAVDRFQTDPDARLLICNTQAGGVGITLTAASDVAFVELPWRPGDLDQAEDRCHRIGQHDSVTAWYLLADRTVETEIAETLDEKRGVIEAIHDGAEVGSYSILGALRRRLREQEAA